MSIFHEKPVVSYRKMSNGRLVRLVSYPETERKERLATVIACLAILFLGIAGSTFLFFVARGPGQ